MAEDKPDDGVHSSAMAEDGVTDVPSESAKVGDKTKFDHGKYPADPTKNAPDDGAEPEQTQVGAADEQATTFKRSI